MVQFYLTTHVQWCNIFQLHHASHSAVITRNVMKLEFKFDNVRTSDVLTHLNSECCKRMRIRGKILVLRLISYAQRPREHSQIQPITQTNTDFIDFN